MIRFEIPRTLRSRATRIAGVLVLVLALAATGCAKKEPKPVHTEPWLAHPPASASLSPDAALPTTHYVLTDQSLIRFELPTKRGKVQGKLTKVSGELTVALGALAQSRGQVRVELGSLSLDSDDADSAAWLARAKTAFGVADGGATPAPVATFDVSALSEVSPEALEPARAGDGGAPSARRARATAEGNLLLNGFRVLKREPLEAEFGFTSDRAVPATVVIRSRAPLVISLDTHEIHLREPPAAAAERRRSRPAAAPHDVRVSVELYGTKN